MKERPILFSAPMVLALLAGTKTQTRRIVKEPAEPAHGNTWAACLCGEIDASDQPCVRCEAIAGAAKYGKPGDRLWVRETWAPCEAPILRHHFQYAADGAVGMQWWMDAERMWKRAGHTLGVTQGDLYGVWVGKPSRWCPSIHMPRSVSRITLDVTGVRVERLQAVSTMEAVAEGIALSCGCLSIDAHVRAACVAPVQWRDYLSGDSYDTPTPAYRSLWESINGPGSWDANPWVWVVEFKRVER